MIINGWMEWYRNTYTDKLYGGSNWAIVAIVEKALWNRIRGETRNYALEGNVLWRRHF